MTPIVFFPQPDFFDILRSSSESQLSFKIKELDEGTVIHITVKKNEDNRTENESRVIYVTETSCPEQENLDKFVTDLLKSKKSKSVTKKRVVIIVPKEEGNFKPMVFMERSCREESSEDDTERARVFLQPSREQLYSRSKGILESSILEDRIVAIIGLGSGGSYVAMELAKAGVGNFILIDFDRLELHNIARHVCGLSDLGRLKIDAMKDQLLNKNPFINVKTFKATINNPEQARAMLSGGCNLIIAATDNVRSRLNINDLSIELGIPTIYGKCTPRAVGGDVIRVRPKEGPCFNCMFSSPMKAAIAEEEISCEQQARDAVPQYTDNTEIEALVQVGLSSDIIPISNMITKLALVELCHKRDSALAPLETDFQASYYNWANRREGDYSCFPENGFQSFNEPSILRWYPVTGLERKEDCKACGEIHASAEDKAFFGQVEDKEESSDEKRQPEDEEQSSAENKQTEEQETTLILDKEAGLREETQAEDKEESPVENMQVEEKETTSIVEKEESLREETQAEDKKESPVETMQVEEKGTTSIVEKEESLREETQGEDKEESPVENMQVEEKETSSDGKKQSEDEKN